MAKINALCSEYFMHIMYDVCVISLSVDFAGKELESFMMCVLTYVCVRVRMSDRNNEVLLQNNEFASWMQILRK